jgi:hypothetical protein
MSEHGTHHEGREGTGYSFAVSGLADMTEEFERMLVAEAGYWLARDDDWKKQRQRLRRTRGTVFMGRLAARMKKLG